MAENEAKAGEAPEPHENEELELTPEIMAYENRRYDLVLAVGVLFFALCLGAFKEASSDLWLHLKSGQLIAESFPAVPRTDSLTYTAPEASWVNPSWLFDAAAYQIYARFGGQALVGAKALLFALAAVCLLLIRHHGPTLWGAAIAASLALITMSLRATVSPEVPALLFLAVLLWLWFQAKFRNRFYLIYLAVPLTILWAQVDLTHILVPFFLAFVCIGEALDNLLPADMCFSQSRFDKRKLVQLGIATVACFAAGIVTPYGWAGLCLPYEWFTGILKTVPMYDRLAARWNPIDFAAFLDIALTGRFSAWGNYVWLLLAVLSVGSLFLNYAQLSVSRVLVTIFALALPFAAERLLAPSAMILAFVMSLGGQEFFLMNWGTETRISRGWILWSQIGRAVTIFVLLLVVVPAAFTGRVQDLVGRFGLGILDDRYMVEAAKWLEEVKPQGNGFPFVNRLASYRAWATPQRQNFVDSRWQVFGNVLAKYSQARRALTGRIDNKPAEAGAAVPEDASAKWKEIFDEYNITHVIVDPGELAPEYLYPMFDSKDLAPVFISDRAIIFGRTDETVDQKLFAEHRIDTNRQVFREPRKPPRKTDRYVMPPGIIDWVWRNRYANPPGLVSGAIYTVGLPGLERPGAEYLAISRFREAVADNPDNPESYLQLAIAHHRLFAMERIAYLRDQQRRLQELQSQQSGQKEEEPKSAEKPQEGSAPAKAEKSPPASKKSGSAPKAATPAAQKEAAAKVQKEAAAKAVPSDETSPSATPPPPAGAPSGAVPSQSPNPRVRVPSSFELMPSRHYQIITAAQNAAAAGADGWRTHMKIYEICNENQFFDLALHHLKQALLTLPSEMQAQVRQQHLTMLEIEVERRREAYEQAVEERRQQLEQSGINSDRPIERAQIAIRFQLPMLAVEQLESASPFAPETMQAAAFAGDLYLRLGLPERAQGQLQNAQRQQQMSPGEWEWAMAQIRLLDGHYQDARDLMQHAIAEVRRRRITDALTAFESRVRSGSLIGVPLDTNNCLEMVAREANYLFCLGLLRIEMGEPQLAVEAFKQALARNPRFALRAVIELYWHLISDDKLPAELPFYDPEYEIAKRFQPKDAAAPAAGGKGQEDSKTGSDEKTKATVKPKATSKEAAKAKGKAKAKSAPKAEAKAKPKAAPKPAPVEKPPVAPKPAKAAAKSGPGS